MKRTNALIAFALCFGAGMTLMWGLDKRSAGAVTKADGAVVDGERQVKEGAVKIELFVMSQCPYGVQAVNAFAGPVKALGEDVDLRVEYIGTTSPTGELGSMHGPAEVKGNIAQLCAIKHSAPGYPQKWLEFIECQNKDMRTVDTNWEKCAGDTGVPLDALRACIDGDEGKTLLAESFKRAEAKGATGSPTIYIGGAEYQGGRRPNDLYRAICAAYKGNKPEACSKIPEAPKVNVTFLSDKRCAECDTRDVEGKLRSMVAAPVVKNLDYAEAEGKKLYDQIKPAKLPVAVFDKTIDADQDASTALARYFKDSGELKVLPLGDAWNPSCADDGGCELDECKKTMQCRAEEPNKLEVFVMSECPYGVKALDAMKEVLKNFDDNKAKVEFAVHFIGDGNEKDGLKSMHGQSEVDEDLREACAAKHYAKDRKFMSYIWCRNQNIRSPDWKSCTGGDTGIDAKVIEKCSTGDEGKKILAASFAYSESLGIGASPTWLANGRYKFSGIDPETIKTNLCAHNKLGGCDKTLTGMPAQQQGGAQPGCSE